MTLAEIRAQVRLMDTPVTAQADEAWGQLRELGAEVVPYLVEAYPTFRKQQGRVALVFHAIRFARVCEDAYRLGLAALNDKAAQVRYRACGLLAYAQRPEALPALKALLSHPESRTVEDAKAAIDAIQRRNHHYFVDRNHTGRSFWRVNEGDGPAP
ncbi:MAG: hypothetical protein M5U26_25730 [Planctomycetota bacterium]|nr:hypothetical protein [Planctomycetota bacterium]